MPILARPAQETFTYDADGNLTDDGLWHYTWDAETRSGEWANAT